MWNPAVRFRVRRFAQLLAILQELQKAKYLARGFMALINPMEGGGDSDCPDRRQRCWREHMYLSLSTFGREDTGRR